MRLLRIGTFAAVSTLALVLLLPGAFADPKHSGDNTPNPGGDVPGNPAVRTDGAYCFDAADPMPDVTCVVLYGHIFDLLNRVPINVQHPHECAEDLARGFTAFPTVEPIYDFNQLTFYSSPGFVEYEHETASCTEPYLHPERGLTSDVEILDTGIPIRGFFYLSADFDEYSMLGGDGLFPANADTGVMPCLTVRMTMWTGGAARAGDLIAEGQTTKSVVSTTAGAALGTEIPDPCPGSAGTTTVDRVTEFVVDLGAPRLDLPRIGGFNVHVEWWQHDAGSGQVAQREWNVHTGNEYKTRVVIPLKNPVRVERLHPQPFDGKLYLQTSVNSPWGSYDIDPDSMGVSLFDSAGQEVLLQHLGTPIIRWALDHGSHFKPVSATFPWDYRGEGLEPGTYTLRLEVRNWQHTATAAREVPLTIEEDGGVQGDPLPAATPHRLIPGPAVLGALVALGAAATASRRRRRV